VVVHRHIELVFASMMRKQQFTKEFVHVHTDSVNVHNKSYKIDHMVSEIFFFEDFGTKLLRCTIILTSFLVQHYVGNCLVNTLAMLTISSVNLAQIIKMDH